MQYFSGQIHDDTETEPLFKGSTEHMGRIKFKGENPPDFVEGVLQS